MEDRTLIALIEGMINRAADNMRLHISPPENIGPRNLDKLMADTDLAFTHYVEACHVAMPSERFERWPLAPFGLKMAILDNCNFRAAEAQPHAMGRVDWMSECIDNVLTWLGDRGEVQ